MRRIISGELHKSTANDTSPDLFYYTEIIEGAAFQIWAVSNPSNYSLKQYTRMERSTFKRKFKSALDGLGESLDTALTAWSARNINNSVAFKQDVGVLMDILIQSNVVRQS